MIHVKHLFDTLGGRYSKCNLIITYTTFRGKPHWCNCFSTYIHNFYRMYRETTSAALTQRHTYKLLAHKLKPISARRCSYTAK